MVSTIDSLLEIYEKELASLRHGNFDPIGLHLHLAAGYIEAKIKFILQFSREGINAQFPRGIPVNARIFSVPVVWLLIPTSVSIQLVFYYSPYFYNSLPIIILKSMKSGAKIPTNLVTGNFQKFASLDIQILC